ncbi:hypothetical protein SLEP1_g33206 [Rubroshorea leprosula]|uniref:Uncharacterized protein n=1 Tax=Rubroshorea leprosula TaxID=152421 RepID=A0AAV5KFW5_9ROSI|nr:hypothetical protein SLEP1_g33206 [Rubroshorea leprosula]
MDLLREEGVALLDSFVDPVVINHPVGHSIPKLDEKSMEVVLSFIEMIQKMPSEEQQ